MRKTMLTLLGAALVVATTFQVASARERHLGRKAERAPASSSQSARSSNADLWPTQWGEPDHHRYPGH